MDWHSSKATTGAHALDPELGVVLTVTEAVDGWWNWHAYYEDAEWTPDLQWFASRLEAEGAAMEWAATLAEQYIGVLTRRQRPQLAVA